MAKWRTHNWCPVCKGEFLKTELNESGICKTCVENPKKVKMSRKDVKIVTKRKAAKCNHCSNTIKPGEKAVTYRYEAFFHDNNFGNMCETCVELTD